MLSNDTILYLNETDTLRLRFDPVDLSVLVTLMKDDQPVAEKLFENGYLVSLNRTLEQLYLILFYANLGIRDVCANDAQLIKVLDYAHYKVTGRYLKSDLAKSNYNFKPSPVTHVDDKYLVDVTHRYYPSKEAVSVWKFIALEHDWIRTPTNKDRNHLRLEKEIAVTFTVNTKVVEATIPTLNEVYAKYKDVLVRTFI